MANVRDTLDEGRFYHIYNHACGNENIFQQPENYRFFLKRYQRYIVPVAETYAYSLMPNHFHLLVRMKEINSIQNIKRIPIHNNTPDYSHAFGTLFNSYTKAFNKLYDRKGSLLYQSFKRVRINTEEYLRRLIIYIHLNPVNHEFVSHPSQWEFSSYNPIITGQNSFLCINEVVELFEDKENFIYNHLPKNNLDDKWTLE